MAQSNKNTYKGDVMVGEWDDGDELMLLLYDHVRREEAIRVGLDRGAEVGALVSQRERNG